MNRSAVTLLVSALLVAVACNATVSPSPSPGASQPGSPAPSSDAGDVARYFSIDEVGLGPDGYVTLLNYTEVAASLDRVFLCQDDHCVDLPDVVVDAGHEARIAVGSGEGLEDVAMTNADLDLPPADGEVAVFSSETLTDAGAMRAYLQWGSTPHTLTGVAVEAGLWIATAYAPTGPNATRLWKTDANLWVWDPGI
jgi:hypothetical protein